MRTKSDIDKAYKPNGITDNRDLWFTKDELRAFTEADTEVKEMLRIVDSHDITKSTMGFE